MKNIAKKLAYTLIAKFIPGHQSSLVHNSYSCSHSASHENDDWQEETILKWDPKLEGFVDSGHVYPK